MILFFLGGTFVPLQAMLPMMFPEWESTERKTTAEQGRRISDSNDDHDDSSAVKRGSVIEAKEQEESEVKDLSDPPSTLKKTLEEAVSVLEYLQGKGPAIEPTVLEELLEKWLKRYEGYQQALEALQPKNNTPGTTEPQ
ncbi:MAG: hypothetical protein K2W97_07380 [Chthoniobacterales bacterium]|nr:hypothetical protein [Chthoniobacterales bacterium]